MLAPLRRASRRPPSVVPSLTEPLIFWNVWSSETSTFWPFALLAGGLELPGAHDVRRHHPEVGAPPVHRGNLVGLPVLHGEGVRDDARARAHLQEGRAQLHVERRQQVQGNDGGRAEIGGEDVALADGRLARADAGDAGGLRVGVGVLRHVGVVLDAGGAGAELLRRRDGDLAVAGAEVEVDVVRARLRHGEHAVDDVVGRRHPDHVLAGLADLGLVLGLRGGAKGKQQRCE